MQDLFDSNRFTEMVFEHRKRARLSLRDAAKQCGVSAATLSRLENGKPPEIETFFKCCHWMILPTDYFYIIQDSYKKRKAV